VIHREIFDVPSRAKTNLPEGHQLTVDDVYLAIPLQKGHLSSRELTSGETLLKAVKKDQAIHIDDIDSQYAQTPSLRKKSIIAQRM
jgi:N-acetylneuraminate synthase